MISVPFAFFDNDQIDVLLRDGLNCIVRKRAKSDRPDNERYLAANALTIVLSGKIRLRSENQSCEIGPGEMVFIPIGLYMISDIIAEGETLEAYVIFFDDDVAQTFLEESKSQKVVEPIDGFAQFRVGTSLSTYIDNLILLYEHGGDASLTKHKILEFLHLLRYQSLAIFDHIYHSSNRKRQNLKSFMELHCHRPLKVEDYAHLTGRSISTFHRDFKRLFGTAPKAWLREKRLDGCRKLLESGASVNINDLSVRAGYDNVSHFIKVFRNKFGYSPKQFALKKWEKLHL